MLFPNSTNEDRIRRRTVNSRWVSREPTLNELLAEPIIRARMAADGVSGSQIRRLIREAAFRSRR